MSEEKGLTKGEVMQILGRALESAGVALDDEESPDKLSLTEILDIVRGIAKDAIAEWND